MKTLILLSDRYFEFYKLGSKADLNRTNLISISTGILDKYTCDKCGLDNSLIGESCDIVRIMNFK